MESNKLLIKRFGRLFYFKGRTISDMPIDNYLPIEDTKLKIEFNTIPCFNFLLTISVNDCYFEVRSYTDIEINNVVIADREMFETQLSIIYPILIK